MGRLVKEATYSYRLEQKRRWEREAKELRAERLCKTKEAEEKARKQREAFDKKQREEGCFKCKEGKDFRDCIKVDGQGRRGSQEAWAIFRCPTCMKEYKYESNML